MLQFKFIEFNPRRKARGVEAARVEVIDGDETYWLWMSRADIGRNIMEFGESEELVKAANAYKEATNA